MLVQYTLTQKANPSKPEVPKKFYANAKSSGEVSFKSLKGNCRRLYHSK